MKKLFGTVLIVGSALCLSYFFFAPLSGAEREFFARIADGASTLTPKPMFRSFVLYSGVALGAMGSSLLKKS